MRTDPGKNNKNFITFESIEQDDMMKWVEKNLPKIWELNIERFPSGASIVKFRWTKEAEDSFSSKAVKKETPVYFEDDL